MRKMRERDKLLLHDQRDADELPAQQEWKV